jgi:hypothetical protein
LICYRLRWAGNLIAYPLPTGLPTSLARPVRIPYATAPTVMISLRGDLRRGQFCKQTSCGN